MRTPGSAVVVVPAHRASWEDLRTVLGAGGPSSRCWCQRYEPAPGGTSAGTPAEERALRLRVQAGGPGEDRHDERPGGHLPAGRTGYRRRSVSRAPARAAVQHARAGGRAVAACSMTTTAVIPEERPRTVGVVAAAGLDEVGRTTPGGPVMRLEL